MPALLIGLKLPVSGSYISGEAKHTPAAGEAGFPIEALHVLGVTSQVWVEDLEGDGSAQLRILGPVDGGEATGANGLQDVVAADSLSRH